MGAPGALAELFTCSAENVWLLAVVRSCRSSHGTFRFHQIIPLKVFSKDKFAREAHFKRVSVETLSMKRGEEGISLVAVSSEPEP